MWIAWNNCPQTSTCAAMCVDSSLRLCQTPPAILRMHGGAVTRCQLRRRQHHNFEHLTSRSVKAESTFSIL